MVQIYIKLKKNGTNLHRFKKMVQIYMKFSLSGAMVLLCTSKLKCANMLFSVEEKFDTAYIKCFTVPLESSVLGLL